MNIILRFSSLGDLVLCEPFLRELKKREPSRANVFASSAALIDIARSFEASPEHFCAFEAKGLLSYFFQAYSYLSTLHKNGKLTEVCIYDLHRVPKSIFARIGFGFFCLVHKIPFEIRGTPKKSLRRWLSVFLRRDLIGRRHIFREHLSILKGSSENIPSLRRRTQSEKSELKQVLIAPDSQHWKKKWPIEHWEKLFEKFAELDHCEFTLVGGKEIFPQDFIDQLSSSRKLTLRNRLGRLPLSDLSLVASEHDLCICGNSAWQHISEGAGVPVISLAGPIIEGFGFSPWLPQSIELALKLKCRPCTRHGDGLCDQKGEMYHACMRHISPDLVFNEFRKRLLLEKKA